MQNILADITVAVLLFLIGFSIYLNFNGGLAPASKRQQFCRYLVASILSGLLLALSGRQIDDLSIVAAGLLSLLWMITCNVLGHLTYRKTAPDYDNRMDIAFGIYVFGWIIGLHTALSYVYPILAAVVIGVVESLLAIVPIAQWGYYILYDKCIDMTGMQAILETNGNEIIEFFHSYSWRTVAAMALAVITPFILFVGLNLSADPVLLPMDGHQAFRLCLGLMLFVGLTIYIWKSKHGVFVRTGIMVLLADTRHYMHANDDYKRNMNERLKELMVSHIGKELPSPHTIIMVIGESACRDYMDCYVEQPFHNTPWESSVRMDERHFIFFPHAYSCAIQTVPSLERALTEKNLYNDKTFMESCSFVDIAHKAGYKVYWYSNQGHIGSAETPVTLIAETADIAKWTKQEIGKPYYDETLLEFLDEVDSEENNLVVLHLKGNHFNYNNRYTPQFASTHGLTDGDNVKNYRNSLRYTDFILQSVYEYAKEKLHLAVMLYFSDHGAMPDQHRHPWFLGFGMVRIPMWIYLSDAYQKCFHDVADVLRKNRDRYFTNDLVYELVCGIMHISSNHFDDSNSLASIHYKYKRDEMLTDEGRVRVRDDDKEGSVN